jgi:hypothetical protein
MSCYLSEPHSFTREFLVSVAYTATDNQGVPMLPRIKMKIRGSLPRGA